MNVLGISLSASAWLAPVTALAATAGAAAVILLRDHLRLERQTFTLEDDVARLTAEMNKLAQARAREGADVAGKSGSNASRNTDSFIASVHRPAADNASRDADSFIASMNQPAADVALSDDTLRREIRAPLGGILGLATLLLDGGLDGAQAIHARRIKALVEDIIARVETPSAAVEPALPAAHDRNATRVLLAEDDEVNGLFAVKSLEMTGAVVDWVRDGDEAVTALESSFSGNMPPYDLVLMDIRMPRVNGLEATRRIRALETSLRRRNRLKIVAVTATAMPQDRQAAVEAGISGFLAKPYRAGDLAALLSPPDEGLARAS